MKRVLLVDDEPHVLAYLARALREDGWGAVCVGTGEEAVEAVSAGVFDAVLLDLLLERASGWEVLGALRALTPAPVILMTGAHVGAEDRADAARAGAADMLPKPVEAGDLRRALDEAGRGQLWGVDPP